jgi:phosphate/sulfate permease
MTNPIFLQALSDLSSASQLFLALSLIVAFGFEFINGFHDTANAVTTVIYSRSLKAFPAVAYSGLCNFFGVLMGGTAVAFSIVNLLPVDVLVDNNSGRALIMVLSLLLAGLLWNLGTWRLGLPVSSSHTLIGSIIGVGATNSLLVNGDLSSVTWSKVVDVGVSLLLSPIAGFLLAGVLLVFLKKRASNPNLFQAPTGDSKPPTWIRGLLIGTCGAVSFAHGSNDGQKGMGLILLVLIGFMPGYYALDLNHPEKAKNIYQSAQFFLQNLSQETLAQDPKLKAYLETIANKLHDKSTLAEVPLADRWDLRKTIYEARQRIHASTHISKEDAKTMSAMAEFSHSIEYVPLWVIIGVALALSIGTTIGYKRIVVTVAEKIGKTHLNYAQGATAELVTAFTIVAADALHMPVSTTHVLSSGVAGSMVANGSGVQPATLKKIAAAWALTFPACFLLAGIFFYFGSFFL